ncbi:hypothetical protein RC97_01220 [Pectobacterium brasiliense]|nr:hypothetical protein RC97_01220 [Pectobacterium brasiliense]
MKRENERLRNDIVSGQRRVQFASAALATCEQSAGAVRSASSLAMQQLSDSLRLLDETFSISEPQ